MSYSEKKISVQSLLLLKEALVSVFWMKNDLRQFVELTIDNSVIVSTIDWQGNKKFESVSQLIDRMAKREDIYQNDLLKLMREVANLNDFTHLERWEDGALKVKKAKEAVIKLRTQTVGYFDKIEEIRRSEEAKLKNQSKIKETIHTQEKLEELRKKFLNISSNTNHQQRGFDLEKFLNELFIFFDLDPKGSFKIAGEQIDGAFTFENTDYLLEAKWQMQAINAQDLYGFGGKVMGKLKNTLGLYISLGSFSSECIKNDNPLVKSLILMDGGCLMQVLEGRIKLDEMLYAKRRHGSQTGEIFYRVIGV